MELRSDPPRPVDSATSLPPGEGGRRTGEEQACDPGSLGVVVIGRNEGDRLRACLDSLAGRAGRVVYVDSGSTDGSLDLARRAGAEVVALDRDAPFTAARARNAGADRLRAVEPGAAFVQFVDGDCEVVDGWLETARAALLADPGLAVVCGRRREREPHASPYNLLCDLEWNTPVGPALACGGDALMRVSAFRQAGGFDPKLIAGEEPDLCERLRRLGWRVERLDAEMTRHDAALTRFGQWWRRSLRAGHARAEHAARHFAEPGRPGLRECLSNAAWGLLIPTAIAAIACVTHGLGLGLAAVYAWLWLRIARGRGRHGTPAADARVYASFTVLGKLPQALGQARYWLLRGTRRPSALIEYKGSAPSRPQALRNAVSPREPVARSLPDFKSQI